MYRMHLCLSFSLLEFLQSKKKYVLDLKNQQTNVFLTSDIDFSAVIEWLKQSLAVLGVDGSSLLTASQRCDGLNSPYV